MVGSHDMPSQKQFPDTEGRLGGKKHFRFYAHSLCPPHIKQEPPQNINFEVTGQQEGNAEKTRGFTRLELRTANVFPAISIVPWPTWLTENFGDPQKVNLLCLDMYRYTESVQCFFSLDNDLQILSK